MLWCYIGCISDSIITYTNTSQVCPLITKYFFTLSRPDPENVYMPETAEEQHICAGILLATTAVTGVHPLIPKMYFHATTKYAIYGVFFRLDQ